MKYRIEKARNGRLIKRKLTLMICPICKNEFWGRKIGNNQKCSRVCANKSISNKVNLQCDFCGIEFSRNFSKLKNSRHGFHFCNRICKELAQSIEGGLKEIQPSHYNNGVYAY